MVSVYRIHNKKAPNNAYFVDREEIWCVEYDCEKDTEEEAKKYIIEKSKNLSNMLSYTASMKKEDLNSFYERFCFTDDKYLHHRRLFIGKPPIKNIMEALKKDGVNVIKEK